MKFKYNLLAKKLWRIEDDYLYEISEQSRHIEPMVYIGTGIRFDLGNNHYFFFEDKIGSTKTVSYLKPLKNSEFTHYEKKITVNWFQTETIIEFTETDKKEKAQDL